MIKKVTIIACALSFILSITTSYAIDNTGLFIKASGALVWLEPSNSKYSMAKGSITSKIKLKSKNTSAISLEAGYNVTDEFRASLELSHLHNISSKGQSKNFNNNTPALNGRFSRRVTTTTGHIEEHRKAKIDSLLLNAYFDIYDFYNVKLFINACGGASQVQERIVAIKGNAETKETTTRLLGRTQTTEKLLNSTAIDGGSKTHKKINLSGGAGVGVSVKLAEKIYLESSYNFRIFGKAKGTKTLYRSHYANAGVRFNI